MSPRAKPTAGRARREKGTGSISTYPTKSGPRWRYEIQVPVEPGHPEAGTRTHTCAGFASYEDADEALTLVRADVIRKIPRAVGRDTFTPYARRWLDGHSVGNGTRMYIQRVIDAMDPYIGHLQLTDIRPTDLAAAYRGLERGTKQPPSAKRPRKGLATSTVARYANWVNTIFLAALDEGSIVRNPANSKHAGRPKGETAKRVKPFVIWNVEQLTRFCDWALAEGEARATEWLLLARTGMRSGELLGLQWGDIDFHQAAAADRTRPPLRRDPSPRRALRHRPGEGRTASHHHVRCHVRASAPGLAPRAAHPAHRSRQRDTPARPSQQRPGVPVPTGTRGDTVRSALELPKSPEALSEAHPTHDLPTLNVHELRHTHASLLFEAGQSVKVVQERLGHASAQVTLNTYAHLLHDARSRAAAALEDLLGGAMLAANADELG